MVFTDPFFLFVFLPVACLVFHLAGRRFGAMGAFYVLLATSILFYLPWGRSMCAILAASVAINYFIGSLLLADRIQARARKLLLAAGEIYNFGALIWFKYHLFSNLFGALSAGTPEWVIPAGISFYTFHQAAFLADAFNREPSVVALMSGTQKALGRVNGFVRYATFVTFFPQLVIGPITYMHEFQPQVSGKSFGRIRYTNVAIGFTFVVIGLFKKIVLADNLNGRASSVFDSASSRVHMHPLAAVLGILAYYLQLYFDFSGYSDIALGLARIFGIRYPINFFSPFKAVGIIDYYRRWHMTLTRVISRFLFSTLSVIGTRFAARRRYPAIAARIIGVWIPLAINFEVIGLWHAAKWTMILFGFIHGLWYIAETEVRRSKRWKRWRQRTPTWVRAIVGRLLLFALMPLTFALFRSDSIGTAWFLFTQLFAGSAPMPPGGGLGVLFGLLIVYLLPNTVQLLRNYRPGIYTYVNESYGPKLLMFRWRPNAFWMLVLIAMSFTCFYFMTRQAAPFLYQGF